MPRRRKQAQPAGLAPEDAVSSENEESTARPSRRRKISGLPPAPPEIVDEWTAPLKASASPFTEYALRKAAEALDAIIEKDAWGSAKPIHFLVLYARMHLRVYRVEPVWTGEDRRKAAMMIGWTIKQYFRKDPSSFAEYLRWVWRREMQNEKWRRENNRTNGRTMGWRLMCSGGVVTEYRIAMERTR